MKKWGYIDTRGEWAISSRFDTSPNGHVWSFKSGFAQVLASGKLGYIDRSGAFAIPARFLDGDSFNDGLARVIVDGPCVMFGDGLCSGPLALPQGTKLDSSLPSCKYAFIDRSGEIISEERYDDAGQFADGLAPVRIGREWGYIDKNGRITIPLQFQMAGPFSDGLARVSIKGSWGYIDRAGKYVIPPQYSNANEFSEGLAVVGSRESVFWYIDHSGRKAFPDTFVVAGAFFKGLAHVQLGSRQDGKYAYIDRTGKRVFVYRE